MQNSKLIGVIGTVSSYLAIWEKRKIKSRREKFLIFGNGIAAISSAQFAARVRARKTKWRGKKKMAIVAMPLPKMGEKKSYKICERVEKKSCYVHNIFTTFS